MIPPPPRSTLFPYTTLFRSWPISEAKKKLCNTYGSPCFSQGGTKSKGCGNGDDYAQVNRATASGDRKSTRLNSSHVRISYAVFCLKKKKKNITNSDQV